MSSEIRPEELLAAKLIQAWVGDSGTVSTLGNGPTPDLRIDYPDKAPHYVEIKQDVHEGKAALRGLISSRLSSQSIFLEAGVGTWWFLVNEKFPVSSAASVINHALHLKKLTMSNHWDSSHAKYAANLHELCHQNGIESFRKVEPSVGSDRAYVVEDSIGGMIIRDADIAIPWIETLITREDWQPSYRRTIEWSLGSAHLFFWVQSGTPENIALMWSFIADDKPTLAIEIPDGISHVWISSFNTFSDPMRAWVYSREAGWEMVYAK